MVKIGASHDAEASVGESSESDARMRSSWRAFSGTHDNWMKLYSHLR